MEKSLVIQVDPMPDPRFVVLMEWFVMQLGGEIVYHEVTRRPVAFRVSPLAWLRFRSDPKSVLSPRRTP